MNDRWIRPACVALGALVWIADVFTPQLFVVAILLNVPIALSSRIADPRFLRALVAGALVADASAGYLNAASAGGWDAIAVGDRVIAAFSFLLVGVLGTATQRAAARAGELAARAERAARERGARRAIEAVRASVNAELIGRSLVRESLLAFDASGARFFATAATGAAIETFASDAGAPDVTIAREPPGPEIRSFVRRVQGENSSATLAGSDAFGRALLDALGFQHAAAVALAERDRAYGVLIVGRSARAFDDADREMLENLAAAAAVALGRAALFGELARRNDELLAANDASRERGDVIRDLVYALSHDLRTPLIAANLTMRQALGGAYGELPQAYREILERTIASNDELTRLAETLLLVSRYESGDVAPRRDVVPIADVAESVIAELEPLAANRGVRMHVEPGGRPIVAGSSLELRRAILNLVANAIAWTPSGGTIGLRIGAADADAIVSVEDDGYGVPENERATLFERVRPQRARSGAGSGLGLYLVRRIAESHDGSVAFEAKDSGGSVFTLRVPLVATAVLA